MKPFIFMIEAVNAIELSPAMGVAIANVGTEKTWISSLKNQEKITSASEPIQAAPGSSQYWW